MTRTAEMLLAFAEENPALLSSASLAATRRAKRESWARVMRPARHALRKLGWALESVDDTRWLLQQDGAEHGIRLKIEAASTLCGEATDHPALSRYFREETRPDLYWDYAGVDWVGGIVDGAEGPMGETVRMDASTEIVRWCLGAIKALGA